MSEDSGEADGEGAVSMSTGTWESGTSLGDTFMWKFRVGQGHAVERQRLYNIIVLGVGDTCIWHKI